MNSGQEQWLAWALADSASQHLDQDARAWLCVKIGAGEQGSAIADLLAFYASGHADLPRELVVPVRAWIQGYAGSDSEPVLRDLYDQVSVAVPDIEPVAETRRRRLVCAAPQRFKAPASVGRRGEQMDPNG